MNVILEIKISKVVLKNKEYRLLELKDVSQIVYSQTRKSRKEYQELLYAALSHESVTHLAAILITSESLLTTTINQIDLSFRKFMNTLQGGKIEEK